MEYETSFEDPFKYLLNNIKFLEMPFNLRF